jgi:hypothetical protein
LSFGKRKIVARRKFHQFVLEGVNEGHRPEFHGLSAVDSRLLGDEPFVENVLAHNEEVPARTVDMDELVAAIWYVRYDAIAGSQLENHIHLDRSKKRPTK